MISHKHKFIFVHIPKTAGTSITAGLSDCELLRPGYHEKLSTLRRQGPNYFTFTCIRNIYSQLISMVFSRIGKWDRKFFISMVNKMNNGKVHDGASWSIAKIDKYIDEPIDFIIRFENLENDWKKLLIKLNLSYRPLPYIKKNKSNKHYSEYYDQEMINLVNKIFKNEIAFYKWEFQTI